MELLFTAFVVVVGASGTFEIYKTGEDQFFCKMISWKQYQSLGPGDLTIYKKNGRWKGNYIAHQHIIEALGDEIDAY